MSEKQSAAKALHEKTLEIQAKPRNFDRFGRELSHPLTYGEAFNLACDENPKLVAEYIEELRPGKPLEKRYANEP